MFFTGVYEDHFGAEADLVFPFLLPGLVATGAAGAGVGAWFGHLAHGTSRDDARQAGSMLDEGHAALIVIGVNRDAERIETLTGAKQHTLRHMQADFDEAEKEALEAMRQAA